MRQTVMEDLKAELRVLRGQCKTLGKENRVQGLRLEAKEAELEAIQAENAEEMAVMRDSLATTFRRLQELEGVTSSGVVQDDNPQPALSSRHNEEMMEAVRRECEELLERQRERHAHEIESLKREYEEAWHEDRESIAGENRAAAHRQALRMLRRVLLHTDVRSLSQTLLAWRSKVLQHASRLSPGRKSRSSSLVSRDRRDSDLEVLQEELAVEMRSLKAASPRRSPPSPKTVHPTSSSEVDLPSVTQDDKKKGLQSQIDSNRKMYTILKRAKLRQQS